MPFDVRADQTSQLQLSNIHGADDLELRRTIEPRYSTPEAREFLQRHTMAISIKNADSGITLLGTRFTKDDVPQQRAVANDC